MKLFKTLALLLFQLTQLHAFPGNDSLAYVEDVKKFTQEEFGHIFTGDLYTQWAESEEPFLVFFVSLPNRIKVPASLEGKYFFYVHSEDEANQWAIKFGEKGYQTFCYRTFANSACLLNKRLLSYPKEASTFIMLHELLHNYVFQKKINIPYQFHEALADVIANYGALKFTSSVQSPDSIPAMNQIERNEKIYKLFNKIISKFNRNPNTRLHVRCKGVLDKILVNANAFQKDRFDYNVNNAYLVKNENYCKYYFLWKKVLQKQKTIKALLKIAETLPVGTTACEKYLKKFM